MSARPAGREGMSHVHARPARYFMNIASTLLLAVAMSTDAFAAAVGKGAALNRPHLREALRTGLVFGLIEAATPLIGWALGRAAAPYVASWDHWIAFGLLALLGLRMIRSGFGTPEPQAEKPSRHSFWLLAATGFATSIDAMAVGAGLAFIDVNILSTAATIGLATMVMVTLGVMVGRFLGAVVGQRAEVGGGVILIAIGSLILAEHLGYMG
ncbi:putative manganese efflux pump MntP [Caballeronia arationis]|jgi:putative Mn2+ efflux pump MntP|uniref:Putative manganese efflux pump MntP n=2 Tax=Caballeronia arationis TaxID=1777142 RepID=A0A7Z7I4N9_9BURK|nr:putative manganese efflux pump MntP [Caballeronia arationis]SOE60649.1 Putative Mn2+ efflux pump MntP [Caballeronia arationis]